MDIASNNNSGGDQPGRRLNNGVFVTALPLVFFTLFFLVNAVLGWFALQSITANQEDLNRSLDNIYRIEELYIEILRAESSQRGYLLTDLQSYLEPYRDATEVINQKLQELNNSSLDDIQRLRIRNLRQLLTEKLAEMEDTIGDVSASPDRQAIQNVFISRGRDLMQEITDNVLIMEAYERLVLEEKTIAVRSSRNSALVLQILANLVGLVMVSLIYALVRNNYLKEKDRADLENQAKTDFLANLSHEIRTPLTAIIGYTELLQSKYSDSADNDLKGRLGVINRNSVHLLSLLNDTLDLSKIEAGKMETEPTMLELSYFLADLASIANARAQEKGLSFELKQVTPLPARIFTDDTRLRQILLNLISNAVKFTHKGSVTVEVGLVTEGAVQEREDGAEEEASTRLEFAVIDTGTGITRKDQESIFEPFVQTVKEVRGTLGTGLGLTISRRLAELLGGELTLKSRKGRGSTFTLTIDPGDISGEPLGTLELVPALDLVTIDPVAGFQGKVLIADDILDIRMLVQSILSQAGIDSDCASDGQEALDMLESDTGGDYSFLILDINMPYVDGVEVIRQLRAKGSKLPAIALTAASLQGDKDRYLASGFDGYVSKPITTRSLLAEIERVRAIYNPAEPSQASSQESSKSVLVIEDNADARGVLCDMLSMLGVTATGVGSAAEAMDAVRDGKVSLVLSDLHLANENGFDIARSLKNADPDIRVIIISGDSSILEKENAIPAHIDSVLLKPLSADALRRVIDGDNS